MLSIYGNSSVYYIIEMLLMFFVNRCKCVIFNVLNTQGGHKTHNSGKNY